jgi:hypothetical protein
MVQNGAIPEYLKIDELAAILKMSTSGVARAAQRGDIPGAIKPVQRWLFDKAIIEAWLAELHAEAAAQ